MDGLTLWNAPDFELWLRTEQVRFNELYLNALDRLVTGHRIRGNWQAIIPLARQAMVYDPLRESIVQALMEAQAQLGERRAALRDYDSLRTALQSELKVNPLPELRLYIRRFFAELSRILIMEIIRKSQRR